MAYSTIHVHSKKKNVDVKDYEDWNIARRVIAYIKFIIKHRKNIEKECMDNYWFDKNGNAYQLGAEDSYVMKRRA